MNIFIIKNGSHQGPLSPSDLKQLVKEGVVSLSDKAWHEGCSEWTPISQMPALLAAILPSIPAENTTQSEHPAPSPCVHSNTEPDQKTESCWYYLVREQTCGPTTAEQIRHYIASGSITSETKVTCPGVVDWTPVRDVALFQDALPDKRHKALKRQLSFVTFRALVVKLRGVRFLPKRRPSKPQVSGQRGKPDQLVRWFFGRETAEAKTAAIQISKLFKWWPSSPIASVPVALLLAYLSNGVVMAIVALITMPGGTSLLGFGVESGIALALTYSGIIVLRYLFVVAPYKRALRKRGVTFEPVRTSWYDFVLDNGGTFVLSGIGVAILFGFQVFIITLSIHGLQGDMEYKSRAAENLSGEAADMRRHFQSDYNLSPDEMNRMAEEYRKNVGRGMQEDEAVTEAHSAVMGEEAQKLASRGLELLSGASTDAFQVKLSQKLKIWYVVAAIVSLLFSLLVWRKMHEEKTGDVPAIEAVPSGKLET